MLRTEDAVSSVHTLGGIIPVVGLISSHIINREPPGILITVCVLAWKLIYAQHKLHGIGRRLRDRSTLDVINVKIDVGRSPLRGIDVKLGGINRENVSEEFVR
jgi:hypothetical protein